MRIRCTKQTHIKVDGGKVVVLDAHHEYYLDDKQAERLVAAGDAVELDGRGRTVERRKAKPAPAPSQPADSGPEAISAPEKPASRRATKATQPPENKTAADKSGSKE